MLSDEEAFYKWCVIFLNIISIPTFIACHYIQAPYGRHNRSGWGPTLPAYLAWFLMESPSVFAFIFFFSLGDQTYSLRSLALLSVFLFHYFHRTFLYPLRLLHSPSRFPFFVAMLGFVFNLLNSYVQGRGISHYGAPDSALFWLRFGVGVAVFGVGMWVNVTADLVFVELKKQGGGYKIPRGGFFEYVSCANYFGEILEWFGWSIMTFSWGGFGFLLYTCANLVPRARANHRWYLEKFGEDYPKHRKAVIPFLY